MEKRIESVWQGWRVVQKIGVGGFGSVYEIERDVFGKTESAALKVISIPQNNDEIKSLRYEGYDEASISAHYKNHLEDIVKEYSLMLDMKGFTNIVYCDDLRYTQHDDGIGWDIFIKMELLTPLLHIVSNDFGEAEIIKLGKDICNALVYCKKFNVVHRDIKPQNIFVSRVGDYKLGDFGIAKVSERTQSGTKIGTLEYMSPEVYSGKPYGVASDIYSLGLVLYWLLNERRHPFITSVGHIPTSAEKTEANLRRLGGEAIPAPVNGSDELKRIVLKACSYSPDDRYASAEEMLADLSNVTPAVVIPVVTATESENYSDSDKTVALFEAPTQPEISKKPEKPEPIIATVSNNNEGSEKTEVLKKPQPQKENKVDYKEFAEPQKEEKKNKKGILLAIIGVVAVIVIIALILLLRSCGEETPVTDESSEAVSEAVSEIVSETESNEAESLDDVSDVSEESVENSEEISEDISEDISVPEAGSDNSDNSEFEESGEYSQPFEESDNSQQSEESQYSEPSEESQYSEPPEESVSSEVYEWGDWQTQKMSNTTGYEVQTKTQYSFRTVTQNEVYTDWSSWSSWTFNYHVASENKEVQSREVYVYDVHRIRCECGFTYGSFRVNWVGHLNQLHSCSDEEISAAFTILRNETLSTQQKAEQCNAETGVPTYYETYTIVSTETLTFDDNDKVEFNSEKWYSENHDATISTQYRCRTRSKEIQTTYGTWSEYSDGKITASDGIEVRTRTMYRYRKIA